jgi:hypothetical protein
VLSASEADAAMAQFTANGETAQPLGEVVKADGEPRVMFRGKLDLAG